MRDDPFINRFRAVEYAPPQLHKGRAGSQRAFTLDSANRHTAKGGVFVLCQKVFQCHCVTFGCIR